MKKIVFLSVLVSGLLSVSCEKSNINEETSEFDKLEIYNVDRGEIKPPGGNG